MKIEGFTQEEIDFMENVPSLLMTEGLSQPMLFVTLLYNDEFNTVLSEDQFHDRFDDYMVQKKNTEKETKMEKTDFVNEFMKTYKFDESKDGPLFRRFIREILNDYEEFRNNKAKEQVKEVFDQVQSEMDNFSWFADNFTNNFKFLSSWRFW